MSVAIIRRKRPLKIVQTYSLLWNKSDEIARFDPVCRMVKDCDLEIINITYYNPKPKLDDRCMIVFDLKGTFLNLRRFEHKAYQNPDLRQFRDPSTEEEP